MKKEKNLMIEIANSEKWYEKVTADTKIDLELWRSYFVKETKKQKNVKIPKRTHLYNLKSLTRLSIFRIPEPVAVFVIGNSCCGKTSISHKIIDGMINSVYLSIDHEKLLVYKNRDKYFLDTENTAETVGKIALSNFNRKLNHFSRIGRNIVIDGAYTNAAKRGALLRVLKARGYRNFVLVNCTEATDESKSFFIKMRAAYNILEEDMDFDATIEQCLKNYKDSTRHEITAKQWNAIESNKNFVLEQERIKETICEENEENLVEFQDKYDLFTLGFNYILHWDWNSLM